MTIRLSHAQARALAKLDRNEPRSPRDIGETRATCDALVISGYARKADTRWQESLYVKLKELG